MFASLGGHRFHALTCSWAQFAEATLYDQESIEWMIKYDGRSPCHICAPEVKRDTPGVN